MIIKIKVKPNSEKQEIKKLEDGIYAVNLREKAEDNKANIELLNLLKKYFKVSVKDINLIKGMKGRDKIVEVKNDSHLP